MASRIIEIHRKGSGTKRKTPKDLLMDTTMTLGSYMLPTGQVGRGLTNGEVKKWMPQILGITSDEVTFSRQVDEYFANISLRIPEEGLKLEIGLDQDGEPLNMKQYIDYRFAKSHPEVAEDESVAKTMKRAQYFIFDPTLQKEIQYNTLQYKQQAYGEYLKIKDDKEKMRQVLLLMGEQPGNSRKDDLQLRLDGLVTSRPKEFIDIVGDKNIEMRSLITDCISNGVIRRVGNDLYYVEEKLGDSMDDAITYLKDKKNSETLLLVKGKLQEFSKG